MLDDHATDSNHKKMLGMTVTLCSKAREALENSTQLGLYHAELTAAFGQQPIERWEDEVISAETRRLTDIKVMDMYATQISEAAAAAGSGSGSAPGAASSSGTAPVQSAVEEWIDFAILCQQMQ
jgi:hypothetical protein